MQEKLLRCGKKDIIYNEVVNDLHKKSILDDNDVSSIKKDDCEL